MNFKELSQNYGNEFVEKIKELDSEQIESFLAEWVPHCNPEKIFLKTDSDSDSRYIRKKAVKKNEEIDLEKKGHTAHFDGPNDQARDKENTRYLVPKSKEFGENLNTIDKQKGLNEVQGTFKNIMEGKELYIGFFSLGPTESEYSIPAVQLTDSAYVMHSENILYRTGFQKFKENSSRDQEVFKFLHSSGELKKFGPEKVRISKNIDKRRIYIDLGENTVYSANTQYGGNTIGLKKLAMRLAIRKSLKENWLTEHMFIMGVESLNKERKTYFSGAFPSGGGKTSTALLENEKILGDDIAYLTKKEGFIHALNPEKGIFGIIRDVNSEEYPVLWDALNNERELIFSNVLIKDKKPYWIGMEKELPTKGVNFSGRWRKGKKDSKGKKIPPSHPNARFTLEIKGLKNRDEELNNPKGVPIKGIIYGGRDSNTWVPVKQSFSWKHGILMYGACLESETTSATLGAAGERVFNPMSNLDFLSIPIGRYIEKNLGFVENLKNRPEIFAVNYFLKNENGRYLNSIKDKKVWLKWMEMKTYEEVGGVRTPTGIIPRYRDLKGIFAKALDKKYREEEYNKQFKCRIPENLEKNQRMEKIYKNRIRDPPSEIFKELKDARKRLRKTEKELGSYPTPKELEKFNKG